MEKPIITLKLNLYLPSLPIFHENASNASTLSEILHHGISVHAKELRSANALIDGNLVRSNLTLLIS